jgi:hypothetical protein
VSLKFARPKAQAGPYSLDFNVRNLGWRVIHYISIHILSISSNVNEL